MTEMRLQGKLSFTNVMQLFADFKQKIADANHITLNFSDVTASDSAGLALIIEFLKYANLNNKKVTIQNIPEGISSLAKAASLDKLLAID